MAGHVIQGFFLGRSRPAFDAPARPDANTRNRPGPPDLAHGDGRAAQRRPAPGAPTIDRRSGGSASFAIDPVRIGLARGGGQPLPGPLLAKMEAAFAADFSAVRVHVGAQAARIGALAFTTGSDLYFAPGQYQPGSARGQQLIGHELAHVIQQRQGRVRTPQNGVAVVQDPLLEAEADRLGMRAATHIQRFAGSRHAAAPIQRATGRGLIQRAAPAAAAAQVNTAASLTIRGVAFYGKSSQGKGHAEMQALDEFVQSVRLQTENHAKSEDFENAAAREVTAMLTGATKTVSCPAVPVCVACATILQALGFATAADGTVYSTTASGGVGWGVSAVVQSFLDRAGHGQALKTALAKGAK
jgi:hypothetical protein